MKLPAKEVLVSLSACVYVCVCVCACVRQRHTHTLTDLQRSKVLKVRPWT